MPDREDRPDDGGRASGRAADGTAPEPAADGASDDPPEGPADDQPDGPADDPPEAPANGPADDPSTGQTTTDPRLPPSVTEGETPLPTDVLAEALRLTRHARAAPTEAEAAGARDRRDAMLAEYGYTARFREHDATLVCHPAAWLDGDTADLAAIEDTGRAVELPLEGASDGTPFEAVEAHNDAISERVAAEHGPVHGETAAAFATYMSNHHAAPIERASRRQVETFREAYFPVNSWPSERQREQLEASLRLVFEAAGVDPPAGALQQ